MELPPSDAAADIRRTNVEREATYLEFARLEAAAKRRVAQRARVVRDALASTPALAHELERRGVVDDDAALGKLASGLMAAPLSDPPEDTAEVDKTSAHDVADVLREMYGGRRAEHGGIAGELAARRKQLEKRQRDLLRERDRLAEHERVHALTLEERRKVEAAQEEEKGRVLRERNARAASGTASSSDSSSSSDDESEYSDANMARAKADARAKAKASTVSPGGKLQRQGGHKGRSRSFKMSQTEKIKAQQDALRPTRVIAPRRVDPNPWDAASESSAASDAAATSPFALPEVPKETLAHGDREALVRRLQKELGVKPTQRVAAFVPTRAKDRLLRMKLAHSSVAARLKYLESAASYEKELRDGEKELRGDATAVVARDVAEYAARLDDTREVSVKTVEQMCRELALEMCGAVADVLAERPTKEKLAFEKQEWIQRAGPRRLAMCRQTLDDLVREVAREEAMGVVLEVEANHAAAAGFVAKAIAGAVMARLDGDAAAELKPWAPPPPPAATVGAKEAGKDASGGWLWTSKTPADKAKAKAAKEKAKAEKMAAAKAKKAARAAAAAAKKAARKSTRWSLFGGSKPKQQQSSVPEEDEAIDFHARLNFEEASSSEEYWSTSSSDEDDDFAYDTAVGRHACQHMLNEMQRRRPPGLVFHHTQPLRPASPPPGIARGAVANTNFKETKHAAGGDDADASSSESDGAFSDSSDSLSDSDSDSEAAAEKRRVAAALEKQRRAAEAEAKAKMQPPPRSGVANLGVLAEPPPPSQAHRAALAAERRYWREVRVAHAFGGKGQRTTIEVKKGAVTSMATAKSGPAQVLAAGTSQGELVVWKFSAPDACSDEDDEAEGLSKKKGKEPSSSPGNVSSPGKKLSKRAEAAKAAKEAKEKEEAEKAEKAEKEKREKKARLKEIAKPPAVVARAECSFHPEAETQEEDVAVPSAAFGALTSVSWSADASQLCTAERGGSSRMWSLAPTRGTRSGKASGKFAIGETMVLAPVNHATSSPTPDPSPPPPPEKTSPADSNGADSNGASGHKNVKKHKQTKEELLEALTDAKEAAREAAKARLRARERWPRETQTLTRFFPAFTLAGRQPFAMFARPNGDIVRASPATRPAAISDASAAPALSGKIQRELSMFRGAQTWAKGALFKAVERGRRAAGAAAHDDASDSDDGEYASVRVAGGSTFVPTRRLDNAALYREGTRVGHKDGDTNKNVGVSIDDRDPGFVPGSPFVAGVDAVLDVAETFAGGTGEHMGKAERDLLLAPDIAPALPGKSSKKASEASEASKTPYTQDVYRGHTRPVVFLDVLPDSGSLLSVDADGLMCLWSAFQGNAGRCGFGWFSPMGTWRLPAEVTAQVPSGFPVEVSAGAGKFTPSTHAPWIASRVGKLATVFEAPKDDAWIAEDAKAARAVAELSAPRTYGEQLELEPVRRRLDIPGVDPDLETPEQKWRKGQGEVGDLDPERFDARNDANANANLSFDTKTGVVIPRGETRDYFVSQYDDDGRCVRRLRQLHVTRRAAAPIVGAVIASDGGIPDLVVIRRVSGVCAAALKAGGADAALASAPYFTAHTYSLDSMDPTAPRMDMPSPFLPPKGRGALDAKRSRAKPGAALEQAGALAARGWTDPAPYPFALAKSTPATGSEHLVVPTGAKHVGVFSIATGAMCRDFALPGVPEKEGHLSAIKVFDSPHPTSCGRGSLTRSLLAVATTNGAKIWVYALDESAAQILGVDSARATIKKAPVPTPRVGRRGRERRVTLAESESESASSDSDSESAFESDETSENARACVRLRGMTTRRALQDASEARELVRDTREVCSDFGKVVSVFAPRPHPGGDPSLDPAGVGELYLRFDAAAGAAAARAALDGREFDGNVVRASFMSTALFEKTQKRAARAEEKNAPAKYKSSSRARAAEKNER
jgi:splicing factor U2AF subunit